MKISANTKLCLVIASPIGHTLSPQLHNAGYEQLGIDDQFVFTACEIAPEQLADFIKGARAMKNLRGITCTIPHKAAVVPMLDTVDEVAQKIGAVNTVVRTDDGRLTGYNTDWLGFLTPLKQLTDLAGKTVALIGAGGVARAAAYGLTQAGAKVTVYDRDADKAQALAGDFGCISATLEDLPHVHSADILVNATPVGMHPHADATPVPKEHLHSGQIVFDIVYNPMDTLLGRDAAAAGAKVIRGYEMFLQQGAAQFEKYTGQPAPVEAMQAALMAALKTPAQQD